MSTYKDITTELAEASNIKTELPVSLTEWIWANDRDLVYIGFNSHPFKKDILLKKIGLKFYEGKDYSYDGVSFDFLIGHLDQRNWFLPSKTFSAICKRIKLGSDDMFYFEFNNVRIPKGQILVLKFPFELNDGKVHAAVGLSKDSYTEEREIFYIYSLESAAIKKTGYGFSYLLFEATEYDSIFSTEEELTDTKEDISNIKNTLARSGVYIDRITNDRYKLQISNGVISAKKIEYKNGLALGNSYTSHGKVENLWFEQRAMAASVNELQWHQLVGKQIGATFIGKPAIGFETACDPDRNLEEYFSSLGISNEYDVIIIQLGENIRVTDHGRIYKTFYNLFAYLLKNFTKADIYCLLGEPYPYVAEQILNAASSLGIVSIDCRGLLVRSDIAINYKLGDYVTNDAGGYDYIRNDGVSGGHPSDLGELTIANKVLDALLYEEITDMTFSLKLNQTDGGVISTSLASRLVGGVVSIKCEANEGYDISGLTFSDDGISAVKETNEYGTYYVFIMPNQDVEITPIWSKS